MKKPEDPSKKQEDEDTEEPDGPEGDKPMSFWDHLDELRKRVTRALMVLLAGCLVAWAYKEELIKIVAKPFCDAWIEQKLEGDCKLNFAAPGDSFLAYFNLSLIGGFLIAAPYIFYQLWSFVAPGLYAKEKRYVIPFVLASTGLFAFGVWFGFLTAFPLTFGYFLSLAGNVDGMLTITPTVMMADYISFTMKMLLGFGAIFEIPIIFSFLARVGVVTHRKLIRWARYYVFGAFLVAAVLTPPDWASQLVMAIPACLLYGLSIGLVYIFQRKDVVAEEKKIEQEEAEAKAKEEAEKAAEEAAKAKRAVRR